jgi:hypothetical protein
MKPRHRQFVTCFALALAFHFLFPLSGRAVIWSPDDIDGDGIPNIVDPDVDNDGIPNGLDRM